MVILKLRSNPRAPTSTSNAFQKEEAPTIGSFSVGDGGRGELYAYGGGGSGDGGGEELYTYGAGGDCDGEGVVEEVMVKVAVVSLMTYSGMRRGLMDSCKELLQHFKKPWAHEHEPVKELIDAF
ncbi:hypothetical protein C5167_044056 [Papaver somniferum]|uniref:Uncharacterized protein n=1 Tax=Papaver somniferum TaxID=3469 RepID=A0A4Y7LBB3_PAPSO|nr:hypothetical protein C5167_044056 [Papaver somniferum]